MAKEYELLSHVDFGYKLDPNTGAPLDKQEHYAGGHEAGEKLSLPEELGDPLVEAGSAKAADAEDPLEGPMGELNHDSPEEMGYQGEKQRKAQSKQSSKEASK